MNTVLHPHKPYAAAYINDVIIHLTTWADHLYHLSEVLSQEKCHLSLTEAQYLRNRISRGILQPQEKAICTYSIPNTKK